MRVLGLETSGDVASVAVADEAGLRAEVSFRHGMQLSRSLAPRIEEVLHLAGTSVGHLEGIAVSVGPGSFTGVRLGVTVAKSLAFALNLPVAAVGTLHLSAAEHPAPPRALLCSILSASATEVYAALYQWVEGRLEPRAEELLIATRDLAKNLARSPLEVVIVGSLGPHRAVLSEALGAQAVFAPHDQPPRAASAARLGREKLLQGEATPVHALAPRYLRPSAAEARRKEAPCPTP